MEVTDVIDTPRCVILYSLYGGFDTTHRTKKEKLLWDLI